jgi:hypothetical protein
LEEEDLTMSAAIANPSLLWTGTPDVRVNADVVTSISVRADMGVLGRWAEREVDLLRIRSCGANWDGFGAEAPNPELVDAAISFLHELRTRDENNPPGRVALSPDGFVAIEWENGNSFLRAELQNCSEVEWMQVSPEKPTAFWTELLQNEAESGQTREDDWEPSQSIAASAHAFVYAL